MGDKCRWIKYNTESVTTNSQTDEYTCVHIHHNRSGIHEFMEWSSFDVFTFTHEMNSINNIAHRPSRRLYQIFNGYFFTRLLVQSHSIESIFLSSPKWMVFGILGYENMMINTKITHNHFSREFTKHVVYSLSLSHTHTNT